MNPPNRAEPPRLLLASTSPRRGDLLREAGYRFEIVPPLVEEIEDPRLPIREVTSENARRKAVAVASRHPEAVVIGADTLVLLDDRSLSKPADLAEARKMLEELSGRSHQVYTAVDLVRSSPPLERLLVVTTTIRFKTLDAAMIERYHQLIDPLDKAGGYAAQEHGDLILESVDGSFSNVIGLPLDEVAAVLEESFGIRPERDQSFA
jgi:septum formation protein